MVKKKQQKFPKFERERGWYIRATYWTRADVCVCCWWAKIDKTIGVEEEESWNHHNYKGEIYCHSKHHTLFCKLGMEIWRQLVVPVAVVCLIIPNLGKFSFKPRTPNFVSWWVDSDRRLVDKFPGFFCRTGPHSLTFLVSLDWVPPPWR